MASLTISPTNISGAVDDPHERNGVQTIGFVVEVSTSTPSDPRYSVASRPLPTKAEEADDFVKEQSQQESNLMMVTARGGTNPTAETLINYYACMDTSASMDSMVNFTDPKTEREVVKSRLTLAKMVNETALETLHEGDHAELVTFNTDAKIVFSRTEMNKYNLKAVLQKNKGIKAGGMTNIAAALIPLMTKMKEKETVHIHPLTLVHKKHAWVIQPNWTCDKCDTAKYPNENRHRCDACDYDLCDECMSHNTSQNTSNVLILISDGHTNEGLTANALVAAVKQTSLEDFSGYVVGIGPDTAEDFLKDLATALNGTYYQTSGDPETMAEIVGSIIGGERGVVAKKVRITISTDKGTLKPVFDGPFTVEQKDGALVCTLKGYLQEEEKKSMIFSSSDKDANVTVKYSGFDVTQSKSVEGTASTSQTGLISTWFKFNISRLIETLIKTFDTNHDAGKEKAQIVQAYLLALEKFYRSIDAESIRDMKEQVQKLVDTPDKKAYKGARKSAVACTTTNTTMRGVKSGGGRKSHAREQFTRNVRGKMCR